MALLFELRQKLAQGFSAFWIRWPRKVGKLEAEQAWKKHVTPADEDPIHAALDWQVPLFEQREPEYIPHAKTWLRNRRWEDEPPTPKTINRPTANVRPMTDGQTQQIVAVSKIQALIAQGMDRELAKQTVYLEMGWVKRKTDESPENS